MTTRALARLLAAHLLVLVGPLSAGAQSLADIARASKEKKEKSTRKVWTNDDLGTAFPELKLLEVKSNTGSLSAYEDTPLPVVEAMLRLARVDRYDLVVDLGSGDGRIVIMAAERFGAQAIGIELDPALAASSRRAVAERGLEEKVKIMEANFLDVDLSHATVVTTYLPEDTLGLLKPHLEEFLRPGTRGVAHQYGVPAWTPVRIKQAGERVRYL